MTLREQIIRLGATIVFVMLLAFILTGCSYTTNKIVIMDSTEVYVPSGFEIKE